MFDRFFKKKEKQQQPVPVPAQVPIPVPVGQQEQSIPQQQPQDQQQVQSESQSEIQPQQQLLQPPPPPPPLPQQQVILQTPAADNEEEQQIYEHNVKRDQYQRQHNIPASPKLNEYGDQADEQIEQEIPMNKLEQSQHNSSPISGGKSPFNQLDSEHKRDSSISQDEHTPLNSNRSKLQQQSKLAQRHQRKYDKEIEERNHLSRRDDLLDKMKTNLSLKNIHPFDLLIQYDDPSSEYQIRLFELEMAMESIGIKLSKRQQQTILKYYKIPDTEIIATVKLCSHLVQDIGELVMMAINYMLNKYRIYPDLLLDEITGADKLLSVESLTKLNVEWDWMLEEDKLMKAYNALTDYGNNPVNDINFAKLLQSVSQAFESKLNQQNLKQFLDVIVKIGKGNVDKLTKLLTEQDEVDSGYLSQYVFFDLLSIYLNRALSKSEIMVVHVYLKTDQEEDKINYSKLLTEAHKNIEDQKEVRAQEAEREKQQERLLYQKFVDSMVDTKTPIEQQYFNGEKAFAIDKEYFINLTIKITGFQIEEIQANELYDVITKYKPIEEKGMMNIHEFKTFIDQSNVDVDKNKEKEAIITLRRDLCILFNDIDTKKLKVINQVQVFNALIQLGIPCYHADLSKYTTFDYNKFEILAFKYLSQYYYAPNYSIYAIKKEYELIKDKDDGLITMQQLKLIVDNLSINLKYEDIIYLFSLFDTDRTGHIQLSDLLYFVYKHPHFDYKASELLFKIKYYSDLPLGTIRTIFSKLPDHFIRPFTYKAQLPSYSFRVEVDTVGQVYNEKNSNAMLFKLKILSAEGVPNPVDDKLIFKREVVVAIYDKFYCKFIENTVTIKAKWNQEAHDIWIFRPLQRYNGFFLNSDKLKYNETVFLILEFVAYIKEGNNIMKVSCCFAQIPIHEVIACRQKEHRLNLQGGTILQTIQIKAENVRAIRSGLAGLALKLKAPVVPCVVISIEKRSTRKSLLKETEVLPKLCLIHRNMTQIVYAYRKVCKTKLANNEDVNLNPALNMLLYSLDNPYISNKLCKVWIRTITSRMVGNEEAAMAILLGQLMKLMKMKDFNFNPYFPNEIFSKESSKLKSEVIWSVLEYAEYVIDQTYFRTLNIDGQEILNDQQNLYGTRMVTTLYDQQVNPFDPFHCAFQLNSYQMFNH